MADVITLKATIRDEFGKGAARRIRRADRIPAVMYGHGHDPVHITLDGHETLLALRAENQLLSIEIEGQSAQLALPKDVQRDALKGFVRHVDLLTIKRGEKVTVQVALHVLGEPAEGAVATTEFSEIEVEADALSIPEHLEVSVEGVDAGTSITLGEITLPEGVTLVGDSEAVAVSVQFPAMEVEPEPEAEGEAEAAAEDASAGE
ncbi:50S ribosomal protein L25/general stress protein Ctc [Acidipropionibacterium timonense]|uniref:50S ribosomal protein L25/general stress protein Ctc n=1 Tax=Acidipropionibacterium timonense TaxID=2161818 RepID=UPI00103137F2|nr:50S ribosomal protein L25/general stress protein Ctc [Acidipropionibacterium timonense]